MSNLKSDFPIFRAMGEPFVYLDNAATTHKPYAVIQAMADFYSHQYATIHRGIYRLSEQATALYEGARAKVARFIGASPQEIIFTKGTTEGINAIAQTWAMDHIHAGDRILISAFEHHSNLMPWQQVARFKGAFLDIIPIDNGGAVNYEAFERLLTPKTKLIAITQVSHIFGTHIDIDFIIKKADENGTKVLVDAAQAVPHGLIDLNRSQPDFLVFSGHKMMGPTGIGVLYINKKIINEVRPYHYGGGMVFEANYDQTTWQPAPHRFEAGTPPIAQVIGLGAAIDYISQNINSSALQALQTDLCLQTEAFLGQFPQITIVGPSNKTQKRHCVNFIIKGMHPHDIGAFLDAQGISVRAGDHCAQPFMAFLGLPGTVRLSFYCYNDTIDLLYLFAQIEKIIQSGN